MRSCGTRYRLRLTQPTLQHRPRRPSFASTTLPAVSSPAPLRLVSAYGGALHGHHRGPQATFAEPLSSWLAVLGDAVPFYKDCLVVCPADMSDEQVRAVWARARVHFPTAHVAVMPPPTAASPTGHSFHEQQQMAKASPTASSLVASSASAPHSPLASLPPGSLDVVLFVSNVFADDLLYDAPWHISLVHRALRPHGVLGILGYNREAQVVAPDWAAEDCNDFYAALHSEAEQALVELRDDAGPQPRAAPPSEAKRAQRARREELAKRWEMAREAHMSESVAHVDTYFPFSAVQRRWFVSEYAMDPHGFASCVRALQAFQLLRWLESERASLGLRCPGADSLDSSTAAAVAAQDDRHASVAAGTPASGALIPPSLAEEAKGPQMDGRGSSKRAAPVSDFIDTAPDLSLFLSPLNEAGAVHESGDALNIRRRAHVVDPLEALEECWSARFLLDGSRQSRRDHPQRGGRSPSSPSSSTPLRVQVKHFVITCSNRSMNALPSDVQGSPPRLPSSGQQQAMGKHKALSATSAAPLPLFGEGRRQRRQSK